MEPHERERICNKRFVEIEQDVESVLHPETGALQRLHEKINTRPNWTIFWSILTLLFAMLLTSYSYTKGVSDDQKALATKTDVIDIKNDMKEIKADIRAILQERHYGKN